MATSLSSALDPHLTRADRVFVINPTAWTLQTVAHDVAPGTEHAPHIRVLADDDVLRSHLQDFVVATALGDLVEAGTCALRSLANYDRNAIIVSAAGLSIVVETNGGEAGFFHETTSETADVVEAVDEDWGMAEEVDLQIPGWTTLEDTAKDELGSAFWADFEDIVDEFDALPITGAEFNVIMVALIAAAQTEELLYDLGRWGEDVGLASRATFSRMKQRLEDAEIIETSKKSMDIGRPRQRLHLATDEEQPWRRLTSVQ